MFLPLVAAGGALLIAITLAAQIDCDRIRPQREEADARLHRA